MLGDAETQRFDEEVMVPERWEKLKEIFHAAMPMSERERSVFLNEACAGDEKLRREAESLIAAGRVANDPVGSSAFTLVMEALAYEETASGETGSLSEGNVLDERYTILEEIPGGAMGDVYRAHDQRLGWTVIIKVLKADALKNSWVVDKFRQEKRALAQIDHPNVVRLVDAGEFKNGAPYLVMKYVEGSDLSRVLATAEGGLEQSRVASIIQQAGHGVAALHEAGLVHRDIKPSNLMLADKDRKFPVKVIDLGIVRVLEKSTMSGKLVGTPLYMSPEQVQKQDVTPASDVYALGLIAYEMLAGRHLYVTVQTLQELHSMQRDEGKIKQSVWQLDIPEAAKLVILKALSYDAAKRQQYDAGTQRQAAQVFGDDLAEALLEAPPKDGARRSSKVWLIGAALSGIVLAGTLLWWWQHLSVKRGDQVLTYGLTIVRQRDGRTTKATGREMFDTGDTFKFNIIPARTGALYIFNQGTSQNWHVLFPTRENNQLDARVTSGQVIETKEYEFTNQSGAEKGMEKIWIIWAVEPVKSLDEIIKQSVNTELTLRDTAQQNALQSFVSAYGTPPPEAIPDKDQSRVTLNGRKDILVYLLELEHKDWK
ncbi:MAG TPA: protein kinase [Pyrinomonadaceae bacterium]|jgi:serine/threonine protein kinase